MISNTTRNDVTLHDRTETGTFASGTAWAKYHGVTVENGIESELPHIARNDVLAFDDPDAGLHTGQCNAVIEAKYIGEVGAVWDKDHNGDGEIHISFKGGPRVPLEKVRTPTDREQTIYGENGDTWVEHHMGETNLPKSYDARLCSDCRESGSHTEIGQTTVR